MPSNLTHHRYSVSQEKNESSGYIDYMNLYVKNLDPTIGNTELFSLFRKFGHIVSARVMSNPATGLSKGYGFVSYSKPEEAALALNEMNGIMVRSKAMVVAYHEPKKPRQEKSSSTTTSSFHSPPSTAPPVDYGTVPYFETRHPHEAILGPGIEPVDPLNLKELSLNPTVPMQRKLSFADLPYRTPHFTQRPSLASILPSHLERVPEEDHRRRKGSVESVMTESSAHLQKIKMTEAVKRCDSFGPELKHIVDMLLTLKKRERSLCLFNSDFLKEKINAAIEALEVFDEDEEEEEVIVRKPSIRNIPEHIIPPPRISKAIPIVAPPSPEETAKMAEIKKLLSSFEGKPIHERKQLLGDQLFPLVKATGVRHAPKITIRLLDTIELEELAKIMFNKELLKKTLLNPSVRLSRFLQDCLCLGTLRGFRYFDTLMRGREELVLRVYVDHRAPSHVTLMPLELFSEYGQRAGWEQTSLGDKDLKKEKMIFLMTGYAKYRCPYVWLRSHQEQLLPSSQADNPLQLIKTDEWKTKEVGLWEMVAEIMACTMQVENPFEIDFEFIHHLPPPEALLLTSALVQFLETIYVEAGPEIGFVDKGNT
ncbi:hypothetical protein G6F64_002546 [Rhizopus arrhizus]|uniref:RRM domain-containing protein n=1 Tax=Rhizopus oryzae TaxID=64495 RepID=A0A9P6XG39_RHIOR|nr:hypothetical protein G6F64_002546 [Rhizopus arrhizus]KAG1418363.1 hypothetical protein G6F58_005097 [Rhizopus delemar]